MDARRVEFATARRSDAHRASARRVERCEAHRSDTSQGTPNTPPNTRAGRSEVAASCGRRGAGEIFIMRTTILREVSRDDNHSDAAKAVWSGQLPISRSIYQPERGQCNTRNPALAIRSARYLIARAVYPANGGSAEQEKTRVVLPAG